MIEVRTTTELKQILLGNKEEFIGKVIIDASGLKYVVIEIDEVGVKSVPIDDLVNMKKEKLQKYLKDSLPENKIAETLREVNLYRKDIEQLYG